MFTLFGYLSDPENRLDEAAFVRDVRAEWGWSRDYDITIEQLVMPRMPEIVMAHADGWRIRVQIRKDTARSTNLPVLARALRRKKVDLPAGFEGHDTELALRFDDDPEREHTDDVIDFGEYVRRSYPGVVLYNQYDEDLW